MIEEIEVIDDVDVDLDEDASSSKLRGYQRDCLAAIEEGWQEYDTQLIELATGCGKTVIFAHEAAKWVAQGKKVLIIAHTGELIDQAIDKIDVFVGIAAGKEKGSSEASIIDDIVVASVQTMRGDRLEQWEPGHFDLCIIDEAHRSLATSYINLIHHFRSGGAKLLGVTATADRGDKRSLGEVYQRVAYEYSLLDACKDGYLVRPIVKQMPVEIDLKGVKTKRSSNGSDFDATEVANRIEPFLEAIAKSIIEESGDRKTVIFMPSVDTASGLADHLRLCGGESDYVSGACKDREQKIADFRDNKVQYMCNAMLLTEGFDDDGIGCVVVLRPTKIRSLYTQCVGRGTRPIKGLLDNAPTKDERVRIIQQSSKPNLLILDFLWLSDRLDLVQPVDLVTKGRQKVRDAMVNKGGSGDLLELEEQGERDMLANLEKEAKKHNKKRKRTVDPLKFAVLTGDTDLADYEPVSPWESECITEKQRKILEQNGINVDAILNKGHATVILDRVFKRQKMGLSSAKQVSFLSKLGYQDPEKLTKQEAQAMITDFLQRKKKR